MDDPSQGYDAIVDTYDACRQRHIGREEVRAWAGTLPPGATVLDAGCGTGDPVTRALLEAGCRVCAIDASAGMVEAFARRFEGVPVRCEPLEDSNLFGTPLDAIVAWGVVFLLPASTQLLVIAKLASALRPGGRLLFTAPAQDCVWEDALTRRPSRSLGAPRYRAAITEAGLRVEREFDDEGGNHYFSCVRRDLGGTPASASVTATD